MRRAFGGGAGGLGHQVAVAVRCLARIPCGVAVGHGIDLIGRQSEVGAHRIEGLGELGADDRHARGDQVDGMGQHLAGLGGVDQRGDRAELADGDGANEELRAVLHEQHHHVATPDPLGGEKIGDAVGALVELAIGDGLVLIEDGRVVGIATGGIGDHAAERDMFA